MSNTCAAIEMSQKFGVLGTDVVKAESPEGASISRTGETRIGGKTEYALSLNG